MACGNIKGCHVRNSIPVKTTQPKAKQAKPKSAKQKAAVAKKAFFTYFLKLVPFNVKKITPIVPKAKNTPPSIDEGFETL
ncbi:MAG: hypothetical protein HQ564_02805 [Candidatus Saganbacteria bacterium]|nr:hypothetical protein [Candidatus Saganbacteria bacterium]